MSLGAGVCGDLQSTSDVAKNLEIQASDPTSPLKNGKVTSKSSGVRLSESAKVGDRDQTGVLAAYKMQQDEAKTARRSVEEEAVTMQAMNKKEEEAAVAASKKAEEEKFAKDKAETADEKEKNQEVPWHTFTILTTRTTFYRAYVFVSLIRSFWHIHARNLCFAGSSVSGTDQGRCRGSCQAESGLGCQSCCCQEGGGGEACQGHSRGRPGVYFFCVSLFLLPPPPLSLSPLFLSLSHSLSLTHPHTQSLFL
jgi:hypothetical protein